MRVEVYFNLHRKLWSIRALAGPYKGSVIAHASRVLVGDAEFVVQPAGREKVRQEGRKNIHAFVRGELCAWDGEGRHATAAQDTWDKMDNKLVEKVIANEWTQPVVYNPYKFDRFMTNDRGRWCPVDEAGMVALVKGKGVFAFEPEDIWEAA